MSNKPIPRTLDQVREKLPVSLLPFQLLLYLDYCFMIITFIMMIILFIIKYNIIPFSIGWTFGEPVVIFAYLIIQIIRIKIGTNANLKESFLSAIIFLILSAAVIVNYVFWLIWQSVITKYDLVIDILGLIITSGEVLLSILLVILMIHR
ncbi:uncharacterized protein MONOS_18029 [Monocercomonoides exilis]|uniref:uncharacterized protein n=1 Tax=Monocercomonoides exilis TaxID=2049356 RepID=UPI00355A25DE|nr:putative membrane protein [Monocercomonoides exilis]